MLHFFHLENNKLCVTENRKHWSNDIGTHANAAFWFKWSNQTQRVSSAAFLNPALSVFREEMDIDITGSENKSSKHSLKYDKD